MATVHDPKYILRLDELPKCVEADGIVWPVFLSLRDTARLFHVQATTVLRWVRQYDLPAVQVGNNNKRWYISLAELNDWIIAHSISGEDYVKRFNGSMGYEPLGTVDD